MEFLKSNFKSIIITFSVIITGYILGHSYLSKGKADPTISVTGLGETTFDSDLIVWRADFSRKNLSLKDAYAELNSDLKKVKEYLGKKGIDAKDIVIEAASIQKEYSYEYDENGGIRSSLFSGYNLTQSMIIQSKNVDLVEKTSREVSELIDAGIELNSNAPEYYYTKLAALKAIQERDAQQTEANRARENETITTTDAESKIAEEKFTAEERIKAQAILAQTTVEAQKKTKQLNKTTHNKATLS